MSTDDAAAETYGYGGAGDDELLIRFENGEAFAWGDGISGTVTVPGRAEPTRVATVAVGVVEQDTDGLLQPTGFATPFGVGPLDTDPVQPALLDTPYGETVIARDIALPSPGESVTIPFALTVPHGRSLTSGYFVVAHAAVSSDGSDMTGSEPFTVLPPRFAQSLIAALETFGPFEVIALHSHPRDGGPGDFLDLNFAAPESLKHALDGVRFLVEEDGGSIVGHVEVNPQEHTLRERLESLVGADRVRFPVSFAREELNAAVRAGRAAEPVLPRLHEILDPYLNRTDAAA